MCVTSPQCVYGAFHYWVQEITGFTFHPSIRPSSSTCPLHYHGGAYPSCYGSTTDSRPLSPVYDGAITERQTTIDAIAISSSSTRRGLHICLRSERKRTHNSLWGCVRNVMSSGIQIC